MQASNVSSKVESYNLMKGMAYEMFDAMCNGATDEIGKLLHRNWEQKRLLADGITDRNIDSWYQAALANGALGGKMIGAGGGGFLLLFASPDNHQKIVNALPELKQENFSIEYGGSRIIFVGD